MHELLLLSPTPISPPQHTHILSLLTGICGHSPQPLLEIHTIYKPTRQAGRPNPPSGLSGGGGPARSSNTAANLAMGSAGGVNAQHAQGVGERFYLRVISEIGEGVRGGLGIEMQGGEGKEGKDEVEESGVRGVRGVKGLVEKVVRMRVGEWGKGDKGIGPDAGTSSNGAPAGSESGSGPGSGSGASQQPQPQSQPSDPSSSAAATKISAPDALQIKHTLFFADTPDVPLSSRVSTSRLIHSIPLSSLSFPSTFMSALGYTPTTTYALVGHHLTRDNVYIQLYRIIPIPLPIFEPQTANKHPDLTQQTGADASSKLGKLGALDGLAGLEGLGLNGLASLSSLAEFPPLDPSGSFLLQASVRVENGNSPEMMSRGDRELEALRDLLRGAVVLGRVEERMGIDSRVR